MRESFGKAKVLIRGTPYLIMPCQKNKVPGASAFYFRQFGLTTIP
jgi:hypothetical protein